MSGESERIMVKSLEFGTPPFRKLGNLKIEFADRLTLIAGHNGIGKSTILGLVANTFGITDRNALKSYFGDYFYANIERIVYLALEEVSEAKEHPTAAPTVVAEVNGITVRKRCSMTQRSQWRRARVVPRTIDKAEDDPVGQDAKVSLPTIYLGIKRLTPIGEAEEREVSSTKLDMHDDDSKLMVDFVSKVILGSQVTTEVTHQTIKGSNKKTAQPGYKLHDAQAISLGQDSLSSIATALASFNRLKREWCNDYPGGLLVIDELDAGFHPHAIDRLVKELKTQANHLSLQIIATTHSPRLIEAVHPDGGGNKDAPDAVVYLLDTKHPRLAEDQSLTAVLDDMALRKSGDIRTKSPKKPLLCVYFEDAEGEQFCNELMPRNKRTALGRKYGVRIKLIPLGIGGSNLIKLPEKDPIFKDRVLIVDADTGIPKNAAAHGNALKLPCARDARGTDRSPENTIRKFLQDIANPANATPHVSLRKFNITNPTTDKVSNTFFSGDASGQRDSSKNWWRKHLEDIKKWGVVSVWADFYPSEADDFTNAFEAAVSKTAKRLK